MRGFEYGVWENRQSKGNRQRNWRKRKRYTVFLASSNYFREWRLLQHSLMRLLKHLYFVYNRNIFTYQLLMPLFSIFLLSIWQQPMKTRENQSPHRSRFRLYIKLWIPLFSLLFFLMPRTLWVEQFLRLATYAIIDDAWYKYYDFFNPVRLVQYLKKI